MKKISWYVYLRTTKDAWGYFKILVRRNDGKEMLISECRYIQLKNQRRIA